MRRRGMSSATMTGMRPTTGGMYCVMLCWNHATTMHIRGRKRERTRNQRGMVCVARSRWTFMGVLAPGLASCSAWFGDAFLCSETILPVGCYLAEKVKLAWAADFGGTVI